MKLINYSIILLIPIILISVILLLNNDDLLINKQIALQQLGEFDSRCMFDDECREKPKNKKKVDNILRLNKEIKQYEFRIVVLFRSTVFSILIWVILLFIKIRHIMSTPNYFNIRIWPFDED